MTELAQEQLASQKLLSKVIATLEQKRRLVIFGVGAALVAINVIIFALAYPSIFVPKASNYASDFSAYYIGVWRLFHAPSQIYAGSSVPGEYVIRPYAAAFKYLPSFLLMVSPLVLTSYQNAFVIFDIFQLALVPLTGYLVYKLLEKRSTLLISIVLFFVLLQPFIPSYYWQWAQGQDKVFQTFLLVLSFYLGKKEKNVPSGIVFGLSFFDPRFALISIPLFALYNKGKILQSSTATVVTIALSNFLILFLDPGVLPGFTAMLFGYGVSTPLYVYSFIPIITIAVLTTVNWRDFLDAIGQILLVANKMSELIRRQ